MSFRQRILGRTVELSIRLSRRHRRVSADDLARADLGPPPPVRFNDRLRDFFRKRWLKPFK